MRLVLIAVVSAAVPVQIELDRKTVEENAFNQNSNLVKAFEARPVRTIKGIDSALLFLIHEYARLGTAAELIGELIDGLSRHGAPVAPGAAGIAGGGID